MKATVENISPRKAEQWLSHNTTNRVLRQGLIEQYALDMRHGRWLPNHQGIGFYENGDLMDGQHRLHGIILAGVTVTMLVVTGIPMSVKHLGTGMEIFTMDTVDAGKKRTVGDQFTLQGERNGSHVAACCGVIAHIAKNEYVKLTTPTARAVFEIYQDEMRQAIESRSSIVGIRSCSVIGAIAFAMKSHPKELGEFYRLLVSGEGIFKSGRTSPVFALRKFILSPSFQAGGASICRIRSAQSVLNAAKHFVAGHEITQLKQTSLGQEFFVNAQKSNVAKVVEAVTI